MDRSALRSFLAARRDVRLRGLSASAAASPLAAARSPAPLAATSATVVASPDAPPSADSTRDCCGTRAARSAAAGLLRAAELPAPATAVTPSFARRPAAMAPPALSRHTRDHLV